jgi:hypothetical protein
MSPPIHIIPVLSFVTTSDDDLHNCAKCLQSEKKKHTGKIILWNNEEPYQTLFGKLQKATISFVMPARQHGTTRFPLFRFSWNLVLEFYRKLLRKFKMHKNVTRITCSLREYLCKYMICCLILLRMKCCRLICRENQNTYFVFMSPLPPKIVSFVR